MTTAWVTLGVLVYLTIGFAAAVWDARWTDDDEPVIMILCWPAAAIIVTFVLIGKGLGWAVQEVAKKPRKRIEQDAQKILEDSRAHYERTLCRIRIMDLERECEIGPYRAGEALTYVQPAVPWTTTRGET